MKFDLDCDRLQRVLDNMVTAGDAEKLPTEYAADFYDAEKPICMEIEFFKGQCSVLSAYRLLFSSEMDGWYSGERVEDPAEIEKTLRWAMGEI